MSPGSAKKIRTRPRFHIPPDNQYREDNDLPTVVSDDMELTFEKPNDDSPSDTSCSMDVTCLNSSSLDITCEQLDDTLTESTPSPMDLTLMGRNTSTQMLADIEKSIAEMKQSTNSSRASSLDDEELQNVNRSIGRIDFGGDKTTAITQDHHRNASEVKRSLPVNESVACALLVAAASQTIYGRKVDLRKIRWPTSPSNVDRTNAESKQSVVKQNHLSETLYGGQLDFTAIDSNHDGSNEESIQISQSIQHSRENQMDITVIAPDLLCEVNEPENMVVSNDSHPMSSSSANVTIYENDAMNFTSVEQSETLAKIDSDYDMELTLVERQATPGPNIQCTQTAKNDRIDRPQLCDSVPNNRLYSKSNLNDDDKTVDMDLTGWPQPRRSTANKDEMLVKMYCKNV